MNIDPQITILQAVVDAQSKVIGPVAYDLAQGTGRVSFDPGHHILAHDPDFTKTLDLIVQAYTLYFGPVALKVSEEAIANLHVPFDHSKLPASLWHGEKNSSPSASHAHI